MVLRQKESEVGGSSWACASSRWFCSELWTRGYGLLSAAKNSNDLEVWGFINH